MDITWYTPQSVHISSCCGLASTTFKAGAGVIVTIAGGTTGVGEVDPIAAVDDDAIGIVDVDPIIAVGDDAIGIVEVDPIAAVGEGTVEVDSGSTSTRSAGVRIEGRKVPYLLT